KFPKSEVTACVLFGLIVLPAWLIAARAHQTDRHNHAGNTISPNRTHAVTSLLGNLDQRPAAKSRRRDTWLARAGSAPLQSARACVALVRATVLSPVWAASSARNASI